MYGSKTNCCKVKYSEKKILFCSFDFLSMSKFNMFSNFDKTAFFCDYIHLDKMAKNKTIRNLRRSIFFHQNISK